MKTKEFFGELSGYIQNIHPYPFWILVVCIYASILCFAGCGAVVWFALSSFPRGIGGMLFEAGFGFLALGGICVPLMDMIIQHDGGEKR